MAAHREGKIERYFKAQVALRGGITRKAKWLCRRGCPDQFWAKNDRRSGFAEIKDDEPLQPHQIREIRRLRAAGVIIYTLSSTEDVDYFIRVEMA